MWQDRLRGVQRNHEVWQSLLSVRSLVLPMHQDTHTWLKFASLCRKSARPRYESRHLGTNLALCLLLQHCLFQTRPSHTGTEESAHCVQVQHAPMQQCLAE